MDKFPSLHIYCLFIQWPTYSNVTQLCVVLHDEIFSLGDTLLGDGYICASKWQATFVPSIISVI